MEFVKHFKLNCYGTLPKGEWLLQSHSSRCSAHTKEMVSGSFTRSLWGLSITLRIPTFWKLDAGSHFCVPLGKLWNCQFLHFFDNTCHRRNLELDDRKWQYFRIKNLKVCGWVRCTKSREWCCCFLHGSI